MKLYVLYDDKDKVMAISEDKLLMEYFILQCELYDNRVEKFTSVKKVNKIVSKYSDLLLEEVGGFAVRENEKYMINEIIESTKLDVFYTVGKLYGINNACIMSLKEHKVLNKAISILEKYMDSEEFDDFIDIRVFIRELYNSSDMLEELDRLNRGFRNAIGDVMI